MVNYGKIADKLYGMMKGQGFDVQAFTKDGTETVDTAAAQYLFVSEPNIMVAVDRENAAIRFHKSANLPLETIDKLRKQIRTLAQNNVLNFEFKVIGKEITPREYSYETKQRERTMEAIISEGFTKLKGSSKTSYQTLESVRLVVNHRKPVNEEIRGSRSRNISSIFVECHGERFRFPLNDLRGARSMARHINEGGKIDDTVGNYIVEASQKAGKLREFVRYARTNNLINESTSDILEIVKENILTLTKDLHKLTGARTYESIKTRIESSETNVLSEESTDDLQDMFTVKRFDEKFLEILPTVNSMMNEKQSFLRKLEEASEAEIKLDESKYVNDTIVEHTTTEGKMSSHLHMIATTMMENEDLAKYVTGIATKINEAKELTAFESTILGNVLKNAKVTEGYTILDPIDQEHYDYQERNPDLDRPRRYMPSGIVLHYDPAEGKFYDKGQDRYLEQEEVDALERAEHEWRNSQPEFGDLRSTRESKEERMFESALAKHDPLNIF